jgi:hypothetical protein
MMAGVEGEMVFRRMRILGLGSGLGYYFACCMWM